MFPPSLRFHAVSDDNNSTLCARDSTLDGDQVIFTVNLYDFQILYGNLFSAHVTCQGAVTAVTDDAKALLPMDDLVDKAAETARLNKELANAQKQLDTVTISAVDNSSLS